MHPSQVKTADDARTIVRERNLSHVKVGVFDVDGIMRGKYLHKDKFFSALDGGMGFCDVVLGWDSNDQLYDNVTYTGWHTAYPDAPVRLLPDTCRELPFENTLLFLGEFSDKAEPICPRGIMRKVLAKADKMGFDVWSAVEYEFFVFDETPHSIRAKRYKDLKPLSPGFFGYSVLRNSVHAEWYQDMLNTCEAMDMPIEGLHTETGAGVLEAAIRVDSGIRSADKAALFKTFIKVIAQRRNLMATFMAKWSKDWPGCGGHIHMSLQKKGGKKGATSAFYDEKAPHKMSETMRQFVAGQQALMPELLAMVAPTVNSFRRLIPGFWAPTSATWGVENRTTALRVIPGSAKSQRVEFRVAAADGNPYLACAAALASGLWGIENKLKLGEPVQGNSYDKKHPAKLDLPRTLMEASERLKGSKAARSLFGDAFVDHYAASRNWEEREFRKAITDWELERYFEII
jgi:glutamine synthetase